MSLQIGDRIIYIGDAKEFKDQLGVITEVTPNMYGIRFDETIVHSGLFNGIFSRNGDRESRQWLCNSISPLRCDMVKYKVKGHEF